jgi:hypothetical protein
MAFETFDLGRVFAAGEQIKGMRRQATTDTLRDRYLSTQIQGAEQGQQHAKNQEVRTQGAYDQEKQALEARTHYYKARAVRNAPNPLAAAKELAPEMVQAFEAQHGAGSFDQLPPETIKQIAQMGEEKSAALAGINTGPDPNVEAQQQFAREQGETQFGRQKQLGRIEHGYDLEKIGATAKVKPNTNFRPLTPEEVAQSGLPPGTSAQVDETTGKIDVLSKRDTTATLNQKDATTAKMKLNTVSLARQQLNNIRKRFEPLKGSFSAGAFGQGKTPSEPGRAFDRSVDQMRSTLTALTRVPGVGAMSDYETKLDQAKFPTREEYESVTQQQIDDLDNMLNAIETGYKDLLSGGQAAPQQQQAPIQITGDSDYAQLPSGTQYIAPDGSTRTKR